MIEKIKITIDIEISGGSDKKREKAHSILIANISDKVRHIP